MASVHSVNNGSRLLVHEELGDGVAIGDEHEHDDEDVPKPEAVQRGWYALRWMDRLGEAEGECGRHFRTVKCGEVPYQKEGAD
jgi:hypothetical protein